MVFDRGMIARKITLAFVAKTLYNRYIDNDYIMKLIKGETGSVLKKEFFPTKRPQVWTRSYFVSTAGNVSSSTIEKYVNEQKTRGG